MAMRGAIGWQSDGKQMAIRWQSDDNQMGMRGAINGQQSAYLVERAQRVRDAIRAHQRASHLEEREQRV
jgi:hypothetical protein